MLAPEDIEGKEFMVSLRGYDRDEVRTFLRRVASAVRESEAVDLDDVQSHDFVMAVRGYDMAEVRAFLRSVATELRGRPEQEGAAADVPGVDGGAPAEDARVTTPDSDDFARLGAHVAEIVRSAEESARATRADAEATAAEIISAARQEAESVLEQARSERAAAEETRREADRDAEALLADAERAATERIADAEHGVRAASDRLAAHVERFRAERARVFEAVDRAGEALARARGELEGAEDFGALDASLGVPAETAPGEEAG